MFCFWCKSLDHGHGREQQVSDTLVAVLVIVVALLTGWTRRGLSNNLLMSSINGSRCSGQGKLCRMNVGVCQHRRDSDMEDSVGCLLLTVRITLADDLNFHTVRSQLV